MMKRKFKYFLMTLILILTLLSSNLQAKNTVKLENEKESDNEDSICIGYIYGEVGNSHGMFTWSSYPFALITTGIKQVRCGLMGQYLMRLSLYHEYNVTAHVIGFKPLTKHVYLTEEEPNRKITFDMYGLESEDITPVEKSKPKIYGIIFGITGGVFEHASWAVPRTQITVENRTITSGRIYGFYIIFFLQIGKTYTITAYRDGYSPLIQNVILTPQKPIQRINFYMYPN